MPAASSEALSGCAGRLAADTRFHLRHETFNLAAEPTIADWLAAGRIDLLAFNDHVTATLMAKDRADKITQMAKRSGLSAAQFTTMITEVERQADAVPPSIARLAAIGREAGVPLLSHDDACPSQRQWYRALGCRLAEFPINLETAQEGARGGDAIVFGAPNIVRGGSHTGWTKAADMVERGLCSILASDYYYPAPALAAFRLVADGILGLGPAWALIAEAPGPGRRPARSRAHRAGPARRPGAGRRPTQAAPAHRRHHCQWPPGASRRRQPAARGAIPLRPADGSRSGLIQSISHPAGSVAEGETAPTARPAAGSRARRSSRPRRRKAHRRA